MPLMEFQRCGVVGVSSPDERTLGGKSRENRFLRATGVSTVEDDECLLLPILTGVPKEMLLVGVLISPSSVIQTAGYVDIG